MPAGDEGRYAMPAARDDNEVRPGTAPKNHIYTPLNLNAMLPTEQQVKDAATKIAAEIHKICTIPNHYHQANAPLPSLIIHDHHGIYVPLRFCNGYTNFSIKEEDFDNQDFNDFFDELLTSINEHTPEPYTVFWHDSALWYGNESEFLTDTDPEGQSQEPF